MNWAWGGRGVRLSYSFLRLVKSLPDPRTGQAAYLDAVPHLPLQDSNVEYLISGLRPTLVDSTCLTSRKRRTELTWGVCGRD